MSARTQREAQREARERMARYRASLKGPGRYEVTANRRYDQMLSYLGARWMSARTLAAFGGWQVEEVRLALEAGLAAGVVERGWSPGRIPGEWWRRPVTTTVRKHEPRRGAANRAQARTLRIDEIEGTLSADYRAGKTLDELAERYGVAPRTISARLKAAGEPVRRPGPR